jgi:3-hydroxypropanoate dehydrogenase
MTDTLSEPIELGTLDEEGRALLFTSARTSNTFSPEPVTDEELASIWDLAKWPPTLANIQPLRVVFVRSEAGKERLIPLMSEGNREKTNSAPAVAILAADSEFHLHIPEVFPHRPEMKEYFGGDDAMRANVARNNAWLQAGYFILAVRANGLAAGPMAGFDNEAVDKEFFPEGTSKSIVVVNIGHPGETPWFDRLPRLGHKDAITFA